MPLLHIYYKTHELHLSNETCCCNFALYSSNTRGMLTLLAELEHDNKDCSSNHIELLIASNSTSLMLNI